MIDFTDRQKAEIFYEHIKEESLDNFILDPVLIPTESHEDLNNIIAKAVWTAGKEYFIQGFLLGRQ